MNIFVWVLFGVINGLILYTFEGKKANISPIGAVLTGVLGALAGGTAAYLFFGGVNTIFNTTLLLAICFEVAILYLLLSGKSFKRT